MVRSIALYNQIGIKIEYNYLHQRLIDFSVILSSSYDLFLAFMLNCLYWIASFTRRVSDTHLNCVPVKMWLIRTIYSAPTTSLMLLGIWLEMAATNYLFWGTSQYPKAGVHTFLFNLLLRMLLITALSIAEPFLRKLVFLSDIAWLRFILN